MVSLLARSYPRSKVRLLLMRLMVALIAACLGAALAVFAAQSAQAATPSAAPQVDYAGQTCTRPVCGNGVCETTGFLCSKEDCRVCAADCCPTLPPPDPCAGIVCGDGVCGWSKECGDWTDRCPQDCTACGDGLCNTIIGDCKEDCPLIVPTTQVPVFIPRDTDTPTPTDSPTPTATRTATATSTSTATRTASPTATSTTVPVSEQECGLVSYESRPIEWKESYRSSTNSGDYVPEEEQDREVWVCPVPPSGERLCIPTYRNLMKEARNNTKNIRLADCDVNGICRVFEQTPEQTADEMCFIIGEAGTNPTCEFGCALLPDAPSSPFPWWILLLLLLLLILLIILMQRRRRDQAEVAEDTSGLKTASRALSPDPIVPPIPPMPPADTNETQLSERLRASDYEQTLRVERIQKPADETQIPPPSEPDADEDDAGTLYIPKE